MPPPRNDARNDTDPACPACGTPFTRAGRRRYCSHAWPASRLAAARAQREIGQAREHSGIEGHMTRRITGRVGKVRPTSENPAATNMARVPVYSADPLTREAFKAATSTG